MPGRATFPTLNAASTAAHGIHSWPPRLTAAKRDGHCGAKPATGTGSILAALARSGQLAALLRGRRLRRRSGLCQLLPLIVALGSQPVGAVDCMGRRGGCQGRQQALQQVGGWEGGEGAQQASPATWAACARWQPSLKHSHSHHLPILRYTTGLRQAASRTAALLGHGGALSAAQGRARRPWQTRRVPVGQALRSPCTSLILVASSLKMNRSTPCKACPGDCGRG